MNNCPYCGAPGGGAGSCASCQHHLPNSSVNSGRASGNQNGSNNAGCFPQGTTILTPSGSQDITDLKKNDLVCSICTKSNNLVFRRVLSVVSHSNHSIWNLRFEDGETIRTTAIHSFRTDNGWKAAMKIGVGENILHCGKNGIIRSKTVEDSFNSNSVEDVFNLIIEKDFNFIADGAIAHSFTHLRSLRCLFWSLPNLANRTNENVLASSIA